MPYLSSISSSCIDLNYVPGVSSSPRRPRAGERPILVYELAPAALSLEVLEVGLASSLYEKTFASVEACEGAARGRLLCVFVDGINLKRGQGGSYKNVIGVVGHMATLYTCTYNS